MPLRFLGWVLKTWTHRVPLDNSENSNPPPTSYQTSSTTLEYRTCDAEGANRQQPHENDSDEEVIVVKQDVLGQ
ncbi:hypothetical protein M422DRAFT_26816 [Sphaerobolus stellatus SS14]|nr:hypothetical protein M422DRAFT_26816 [Sphaerobolus stellatus SS14]